MSVNGAIEIDWADGKHKFNVAKFEQAFELEDKCGGIGLYEIWNLVQTRRARVTHLVEIHRLGLIGAGMPPQAALKLVRRYVEGRPWAESFPSANLIMMAALVGVPEDNAVGKSQADRTETEPVQTGLSDPQSTASALQ